MNFYLLFKKGFADLPRPILRVMKLTIVILTTFLLQVSAAGFAQKISLKENDASLVDVFKAIRQQTGYDFVYTTKQIQKAKKVSIDVQNLSLGEVLQKCFEGQPFTYTIEEKAIVIQAKTENITTTLPVQVADQLVKGIVKDAVGLPLQNVTVYIEGVSNSGVATDSHGEFAIKADVGARLHFTLVGYEPVVVELKNKATLNVTMHMLNAQLGEVVVVGYGQTKKADLTSAVSTINAEQITEMPTTNLSQVFAGRIPGVLARNTSGIAGSENSTLLVRTTNQTEAPLLVVDGVPRFSINSNNQVNLNTIDPSEVESITVLKDNAATAVYGSQGANGVIIVTTKRGKLGKPQFSYNGNYTLSSPAKMVKQIDSYEYAQYLNTYYVNNGLTAPYSAAVLDTIQNNLEPYKYANTNWVKLLTNRQSFVSNQNLDVTGGSDAIKYYILGSYADEGGMYATNNYKRYTFQNNLDIKLSDQFKAQVNLSYRNSVQNLPSGGDPMNIAINASPLVPAYNANGSYGIGPNGGANPVAMISSAAGFNTTTYNYGTANGRLTYTPTFLPGLSAYANFYVEKSFMREKIYTVPIPLYTPSSISSTGYAEVSGSGNPSLEDEYIDANTYTEDFALNYDKHWGKSSFSALVLYTVAGTSSNANTDTRLNLVAPGLPILNLGSTTGESTSGTATQFAREGYVGRITYDFDKRFYAEGSFRDDGSTYFAPGERWGFFPGGSLGWVVSKEGFFQSLTSVVDALKIRGSIGLTGDDNIGANTYYYTYKIANTGVQNSQGYVFGTTYTPTFYLANSTLPNADITWAKNREENLGFDADLWHGRLGVIFDIYQKDRYDMLISQTSNLPTTFGIGGPIENVGKQRDRGLELDLNSQNRFDNNWSLALNANFTWVQTTVINAGTSGLPAYERSEGYSTNTFVGYHAVGIIQNQQQINSWPVNQDGQNNATIKPGDIKFADLNGDGKLTSADEEHFNNYGFPPVNFGFGFTLKYKSVSLTTAFNGALGGYIQYLTSAYNWQYIYDNSWSPSNPNAKYPRIGASNNSLPSDIGFIKDNFLRLRDLRLGYDLPTRWTNTLKIKSVKIFAEASNLVTWTSVLGGIDPETPNQGTLGTSGGFTPNQKNIGLGVNVNF